MTELPGKCSPITRNWKKSDLRRLRLTYIMHALAERGLNVDVTAMTVEEARDSI